MKKLWASFFVICSLLPAWASPPQDDPVVAHGFVNFQGMQVAFLDVNNHPYVVHAGERLQVRPSEIEVLKLDLTNETVTVRFDGGDYTSTFIFAKRPAAAQSWIDLRNADCKQAIQLFSYLAGRTILLHPQINHEPFNCQVRWSDSMPEKSSVIHYFTKLFSERKTTVLDDGVFLQILPSGLATNAVPGAKDLATANTQMPPGMIDFQNVEIHQVLDIYGKLIGRTEKKDDVVPMTTIEFRTSTPLTKEQVIYALETLFRWHGIKIVLNDDNTFSVVSILSAQK